MTIKDCLQYQFLDLCCQPISKWPVAAAQWRGVKPVCVLGFMLSISKWPCNVNLTHLGLFFLPN